MKQFITAILCIAAGAFLAASIFYGSSIRNNLDSIHQNVDAINIMLDEMTANVEKSNEILKELTNEQ